MSRTRIVVGIRPETKSARAIAAEFRALAKGGQGLRAVGEAKADPSALLTGRYVPGHRVDLFDATYYLTNFFYDEGLNFLVAYVGLRGPAGRLRTLHPRIFYKDSALVWRVASHLIREGADQWIGKGDVKWEEGAEGSFLVSDEDTTNLPFEIQAALDIISRHRAPRRDTKAIGLVLQLAKPHRIQPFAEFTRPRRRAEAQHRIHRGRPVARITRAGDPRSLRFAKGFEPDFTDGLLEVDESGSRLYGGSVQKYRIRSTNSQIQYQFVVSPSHVWVNPPQALTTELTSFGIRALHVPADEEIFLPGYEYHFLDESLDPPALHSQIPAGFAGDTSPLDPWRADASPWIEALPVIRDFRSKVLGN